MGIFKSREERRLERDIEVRKGLHAIQRSLRELAKHEKSYLEKAKQAARLGDQQQLAFLKRALRKTITASKLRERQILSIQTALQIRTQAESDAEFAKAMSAVSRSISALYGSTDFEKTQKEFEKALAQADSLQERMEVFLDMTSGSVFAGENETDKEIVSEEEIDRLVEGAAAHEEASDLDRDIEASLREIEEELRSE